MASNNMRFTRAALLVVAIAFLIYNIYQAIITTMIVSHFPLIVKNLPNFIQSTNPQLQLTLFLTQEVAGSTGEYMRLIGAIFALISAILFYRKKSGYLNMLSKALLFESLYFLLYIPVVINHFVGSVISTSSFLNFNVGLSYLLQIVLIFPSLFILSRKLKKGSNLYWMFVAATFYVFGMWIRHGFLWVYGIFPMQTQLTLIDMVGSVNSLLTLLLAAIICGAACLMIKTSSARAQMRTWLLSLAVVLAGTYFVIYDVISIFSPIYNAYLLLTDAWMITLLLLGIALFYDYRKQAIPI